MRNCQKCRPCCGGNVRPPHCNGRCSDVEVIIEPTVHCHSKERHHHHCVRHIVPIVYHQAHHHHKHHEYEVKRKHKQKHHHHEHGRFKGNWCEVEECEHGHGHALDHEETFENDTISEFDNEFDSGYESEMYM